MKQTTLLVLLVLACTAYGNPALFENHAPESAQFRQLDIFGNTQKLIEKFVENIRKAVKQATDAIENLTKGLQEQLNLFEEKVKNDLQNLRDRITQAVKNVSDKFSHTNTAIKDCVDNQNKQAELLFNDTLHNTMECANERVKNIGKMVDELRNHSNNALEYANSAVAEMKECTEKNSGNLLATGSCLGAVAIKTEAKGAAFLAQSGVLIARINLAITSLPVSLEMCAGAQLFSAGQGVAKILLEIGRCTTSITSNFSGNKN